MIDWSKLKTESDVASDRKNQYKAMIASRRYSVEVSGITIDGITINTDDRSKLLINGAAFEASLNPDYVMDWKTPEGFITMGSTEIITIARAVRQHVQNCFDRESQLLSALEEGTFTEQMLEEGWVNEGSLYSLA